MWFIFSAANPSENEHSALQFFIVFFFCTVDLLFALNDSQQLPQPQYKSYKQRAKVNKWYMPMPVLLIADC